MIVPCLNAFALSGRVNIICCGITQGVASLALGYVLHWAFSPPLLNPKLHLLIPLLRCFGGKNHVASAPVAKPPIPKTWKNVLKRLIIRFLKSCQFQGKLLPLQAERCSVHLRQYSEEKKI